MKIEEVKEILKRNGVEFEEVPGGVEWFLKGSHICDEDWEALKNGGLQWFGAITQDDEDSQMIRLISPL